MSCCALCNELFSLGSSGNEPVVCSRSLPVHMHRCRVDGLSQELSAVTCWVSCTIGGRPGLSERRTPFCAPSCASQVHLPGAAHHARSIPFAQVVVGCIHVLCRPCAVKEEAKVPERVGFACPFCSRICTTAADELVLEVGAVAQLERQQQQELVGSGDAAVVPNCDVCNDGPATRSVVSGRVSSLRNAIVLPLFQPASLVLRMLPSDVTALPSSITALLKSVAFETVHFAYAARGRFKQRL
jgi:hypothetical protein